ncbi:bromodomain-containing protein DDB_G0280777-like [Chrysoperla carnea]|uniref:bromodomain-containing protein DDB_G0280777-like n=1 Tax=Chrysoperla carnea TaxID=189513 RepID=UPI001D0851E7|nr:bromodomain-containing protein DDB_G0280777-like [Chrysoperla carnea]
MYFELGTKKIYKRLLLISCFIGTLIVAERQINLEDIERDNLASEKQTANQEASQKQEQLPQQQPQDVQPPTFLPLPHQQQQYIPASPPPINYYSRPQEIIQQTPQFISPPSPHQQENYYRRPQPQATYSPQAQYSPQELAEYITDNHLKLGPVPNQQRIPAQIPQYYQNQQPSLQHPNLQQFFLLPQLSYNPYSNNQQKTDGIQYVMYLQPAAAASFLAPQTHIPNLNAIPHIMSLTALPRLYTQQGKSPMFSVQPQQFQPEQQEIRFQPQRKLVIQPEIRLMTIQAPAAHEKQILLLKPKPQVPQPEQYIVVPQPQEPQQQQIKSYPKSLLDSYVPSVLQLQYLKEQQLKQQQLQQQEQLKQLQEQSQQTQSDAGNAIAEHSSASGHLLNTIEYSPEQKYITPILKSASSAKRFAYQSYFPIQHGGGSSSFVNYRLGRYAEH